LRGRAFPGEGFEKDGLADRDKTAARCPGDSEENEAIQAPGRTAHKGAEGEQGDRGDLVVFPAEQFGKPARHGDDNGVRNEIGGDGPGRFVVTADSEPRMWSSDTFTIEVSIISIRVGSMTVNAMRARLESCAAGSFCKHRRSTDMPISEGGLCPRPGRRRIFTGMRWSSTAIFTVKRCIKPSSLSYDIPACSKQ